MLALCVLLTGSVMAAPLVGIGRNFTGSTLGVNVNAIPPDTDGAVGPNHFVEFINGRFAAYSKASGTVLQSMTDLNFWKQAGITFPVNWDVTDPRIVYDPSVQRWFASQVDFETTGAINTNRFLLAISGNADPTGAWKAVSLAGTPSGNNLADFPTLGLDAQGVYLAADLFSAAGNAVGSTLLSLQKAGLLQSTPVLINRTSFGILSYASRGYVLQPAVCVDGSGGGNVLSTGSLGYSITTGNPLTATTLFSCAVQNAGGPASATLTSSTSLSVPGYTVPIDPYQPDGSSNLSDDDCRFSAIVYRVGGILFAVHTTEVNNLAAIRWYRISATNNVVLESGTISGTPNDPEMELFYPSIAANTNGTVVIGFNGSSLSSYVSAYAVVGQTINGVTTFGNPLLLKAGTASYQDTPGSDPSTYESRWGDYSATSVDPTDPTIFWTIQAYPSGPAVWSTQITQLLTMPGPVRLTVSAAGTNAVVSWPGSAALVQLQSSTNIVAGSFWSPVPQTPVTVGNVTSVQVPATGQKQFFRLVAAP